MAGVTGLVVLAAAVLWLRPWGLVGDTGRQGLAAVGSVTTPPPPPWTVPELDELLARVRRSEVEGLRAKDYEADALQAIVSDHRTGPAVDGTATRIALALAHDFAAGRIRNRHRFNWYIDYAGPDAAGLAALLRTAREDGRLGAWLDGLLPTNPQYRALREALADAPADGGPRVDSIKANLERWRWLPRDFGSGDQLYVNLPTYRLQVIESGHVTASYKAVIGATDMPTPVLSASVRQVIANPDWIVPRSIVIKSHLRPSARYSFTTRPDGTLRVRQKPGAGNALGKVKIEFPNKLAIYFHDTPSRSLFGREVRAFSHGCVRVQDIDALAGSIVANPSRFAAAMAGDKTRSFPPDRPWRADIVYLTLVRDADGALVPVGDPYGMDTRMAAALEERKPQATPKLVAEPTPEPPVAAKPAAAPPETAIDPDDTVVAPDPLPANSVAPDPQPGV